MDDIDEHTQLRYTSRGSSGNSLAWSILSCARISTPAVWRIILFYAIPCALLLSRFDIRTRRILNIECHTCSALRLTNWNQLALPLKEESLSGGTFISFTTSISARCPVHEWSNRDYHDNVVIVDVNCVVSSCLNCNLKLIATKYVPRQFFIPEKMRTGKQLRISFNADYSHLMFEQ